MTKACTHGENDQHVTMAAAIETNLLQNTSTFNSTVVGRQCRTRSRVFEQVKQ